MLSHSILNANQAVAHIAFKTNEVFPIYPITPASEMSELVEQWSAEHKENLLGTIPTAFEMQSEAGVAGAMHGALQTGSLSATFTASQGLLLMLPNMYKIAGELTPNVIHVATRSIATHALSVFGDHSDIMACRQSGYAMLGSASVQEAQDFALIAQAATLKSRIPFLHFFDGFRTSHETNSIEIISDAVISEIIDNNLVEAHRKRALNPNNPVLRGTAQTSDVFFQSREAQNTCYNACPDTVQEAMNKFKALTGRAYKLFDYVGHPEAEHLIISMASSTETIETTINQLNEQGEKLGLIKVRLFRPYSTKHLLNALPKTVKSIAVLDRTKEPGSSGEPLYLDIVQSLYEAFQKDQLSQLPRIIGGRYGLSSKEFTPTMVNAIFENLKLEAPKQNFTVGINDDVTHLSLNTDAAIQLETNWHESIFYQNKSKSTTKSFKALLNTISKNQQFAQGYIYIDYKKSNSKNAAHLRIATSPIKAPYLIEQASFMGCQNTDFTRENAIDNLKPKGTLLVNTSLTSKAFWQSLTANIQYQIIEKQIQLYIFNDEAIIESGILKNNLMNSMHSCFLALQGYEDHLNLFDYIYKVDTSQDNKTEHVTLEFDNTFSDTLLGKLLTNKGNDVPVSMLPIDGTFETNTAIFNPAQEGKELPLWNTDDCTQCGACSMACPQSALRIKVYEDSNLEQAPNSLKYIPSLDFDLMNYTVQINPDQCNGCNNCVDACPAKALVMSPKAEHLKTEQDNWHCFETIPEFERTKLNPIKVSQQQLQEPLFKYSIGVEGCGEAPYLKLVSQLFGERLLVANATGASSIFGGALPTTPWSKNAQGKGPTWSNSLFEDNAEFGLGYRLSLDQQEQKARTLLTELIPQLDFDLADDILRAKQDTETEIEKQRLRIEELKIALAKINSDKAQQLQKCINALVKKSIWLIGGDGWAYDIGFGGIDHVLASGKNVNILVLDNEVYDNTGGQASKATPFGAKAAFAIGGKYKQKKDLGKIAMTYDNVYVASVAIGANQEQTLKAFNEAESFDGPSIIIAYCHSNSHGIDMNRPNQYHKAAVNSGQWLLYRNDPRNEQSFQLDSDALTINIEAYLKLEKRFSNLLNKNKSELKPMLKALQKKVDERFHFYELKSIPNTFNRVKLPQNNMNAIIQ